MQAFLVAGIRFLSILRSRNGFFIWRLTALSVARRIRDVCSSKQVTTLSFFQFPFKSVFLFFSTFGEKAPLLDFYKLERFVFLRIFLENISTKRFFLRYNEGGLNYVKNATTNERFLHFRFH